MNYTDDDRAEFREDALRAERYVSSADGPDIREQADDFADLLRLAARLGLDNDVAFVLDQLREPVPGVVCKVSPWRNLQDAVDAECRRRARGA